MCIFVAKLLKSCATVFWILRLLHASPLQGLEAPPTSLESRDGSFKWASIGDSWAAGAAVTRKAMYDDNGSCVRNREAWEALMAADATWTVQPQDFSFAACSGARLAAAWRGDPSNKQPTPQLDGVGSPILLTMELGGNNCQFSKILRTCVYIISRSPNYPEPSEDCLSKMNEVATYITTPASGGLEAGTSFIYDHQDTLSGIMMYKTINGNPNFHLYVVGYATFFSTSPGSDWCNDASFGLAPLLKPALTNALRSRMNELIRELNKATQKSINDFGDSRIKFIDPDKLFEGHRFCEPGHNLKNQYFLNDVWFWNLSPPEDDPDYLNGLENPILDLTQDYWINFSMFPNGTVADEQTLVDMTGGSNPYSSGRTFHPKLGGHVAIKNAVIAQLRADGVPGIAPAAPPPPPPKTQPYASGPVHIHVVEWEDCLDDADNLSVQIDMWDSLSTQIGYMKRTQAGAAASARMNSKLEKQLVITPEHAGARDGYIQFQLGDLGFNSKDDTDHKKASWCQVGGWDPRNGPECTDEIGVYNPNAVSIRQMDCDFPAPVWGGGAPSDGSS